MKHIALLTCVCGLMLLGSCKNQSAQNEQPLEVMTFNVRLDAPSDSANNWKYRKDNVCQMITYYQPDISYVNTADQTIDFLRIQIGRAHV